MDSKTLKNLMKLMLDLTDNYYNIDKSDIKKY